MMVLFHGFLGVRTVVSDYVHGLTLRAVADVGCCTSAARCCSSSARR